MSWVPITAIQDLGEHLHYLSPEDVDEVLNSLTVSRSYQGVTHYRLSDVERALQQLSNADQNAIMYIRGTSVVISNNGNNGDYRPNNGNNGDYRPNNGNNGDYRPNNGNNGDYRPNRPNRRPNDMVPMPSGNGGVYIYLDAETFKSIFRPC